MGVSELFYESIWRDVYVKKTGRNAKRFFLDGVECKENLSNIRRSIMPFCGVGFYLTENDLNN